jgi:hypothetical protein
MARNILGFISKCLLANAHGMGRLIRRRNCFPNRLFRYRSGLHSPYLILIPSLTVLRLLCEAEGVFQPVT